ncbi:MAG: hypothetical protein IJ711_06340 [Lachnospiraceae bacterium]|nr:hypothetical protein [Lachnospiraceae bacterium]
MIKENDGKKVLAVLFGIFVLIFMLKSNPDTEAKALFRYLGQDMSADDAVSIEKLESQYAMRLWKQPLFLDLNGAAARLLSVQGYYSRQGIYVTKDRYIVSPANQTSTDYEYEQMTAFKSFLDERGIHLLYVNEPTKYVDDSLFREEFGIESYSNRNADLFLQRISDAGIAVIDLREKIAEEGLNVYDMFYRTDHHWTTRSGLWATRKMAEGLNEYCGYSIDTSIYDESNYSFTEWKNCWLGEQGRKVAVSYVGLDDYTEIKPKFETSYSFKTSDGLVDGTFDDFIDEEIYEAGENIYAGESWHYSYMQRDVINKNADYGKVLLLGDSYAQVTEPFLSLGVREVDALITRDYEGSVRDYVDAGDYDTVIVAYAQFMIGAHDVEESANSSSFTFE